MTNKYMLRPITGTIKEGFTLVDENDNLVYKAQMTKFKLFGASPFKFENHITNKTEEHTVGKILTMEESGVTGFFSTKSTFKYDGEKIWKYLHNKGIRINSKLSGNKIGMTYEITLEGNPIAVLASSSPKGKSLITTGMFYDIECEEKDLDLVFLVAFSIARTEQAFYN